MGLTDAKVAIGDYPINPPLEVEAKFAIGDYPLETLPVVRFAIGDYPSRFARARLLRVWDSGQQQWQDEPWPAP